MDVIESKGKTVDEAVFSGLMKMDLSIDEVEIEILDEGAGFFKSAKVRMTKKTEPVTPMFTQTNSDNEERHERHERPAFQRREDNNRSSYQRRDDRGADRRPYNRADDRPDERPIEGPVEKQEPKNDAEKFLLGLFDHMGMYVALKSEKEGDIMRVDMSGRGMGMLIGRRGETLDALQYLTSLVVNNGRDDYLKVMLDTEDYRKKREEALKRLAISLADKVVRTGKRVVLEPMNPYERRILHATLQDYEGITTYSEGEDPFRSVVVALKDGDESTGDEE